MQRIARMMSRLGAGSDPLSAADLARWAEGLYRDRDCEPPLRRAVFTLEQLEHHAKTLATGHVLGPRPRGFHLLARLADSEQVIARCHDIVSRAHSDGRRLAPAAEWLLDNHYLIEEQVHLARKHLPREYSRQLPRLAEGPMAGRPRVYDLILEFIAHVDGRVDDEALARYTAAYQSVSRLKLGELWSVAIMLRLALVENLRRVASSMSWQRAHRDRALAWVARLDVPSERHEGALLVLAEMVRDNPPLSCSFVAQFTEALQGRGPTASFVLTWLEQRLAEHGQTIEECVRAETRGQAADQASMANSIASLRLVNATRWYRYVEAHSATEQILRGEPAGVYGRMDLSTRDEYRHVVEGLARRLHREEEAVARTAVALAAARHAEAPDDAAAHVGYLLVDEGRRHLERALLGKRSRTLVPPPLQRGLRLLAYLGPVALLSVGGIAWLFAAGGGDPAFGLPVLAVCAALAVSQFALSIVNWIASMVRKPRAMPRMDFEQGIPDACRTMAVVPTLLAGRKRIGAMIEALELRYLANRDPNLWFALLTDFADAASEHVDGDDERLDAAAAGIEALNRKYGNGAHGRFFLFHRPRLFNPGEGCWMGRERKRGKLEDFNSLLCGDDRASFSRIVGDLAGITTVRYVITLDTDTDLPWGAGWRLVGAAAHPLNRPKLSSDGRKLLAGYAILQPRVSISMRSAVQSLYSRLLSGEVGIDPYTHVVSDVYQDLFAETSFIGKGLYDVGAFRRLLDGRFPDNAVLSHDLLESCYARSAQCSDVELLEDSPSGYLADVSRRHRWMRGDWQIAPWLGLRVGDASGRRIYPSIAMLGRWKIFDNLRRALVAPAFTILLALGWIAQPAPLAWTAAILALLFVPELLPGLAELWQRPAKLPLLVHLAAVAGSTARRLAKIALWVAFLPFEASVALDAALRTLWRMLWSRRRLLEWQTAAAVERTGAADLGGVLRRMWIGPALSAAVTVVLILVESPGCGLVAAPFLVTWYLSPLVAWWVSRPRLDASFKPDAAHVRFLRRVARLTWRYFEVFVGPQENWLPPDNMQDPAGQRVAHRTSPTDMGLALLSSLSASDLGYVSGGQLLDRTTRSLDAMEPLDRHRGHFFNWYDTITRKALRPLYVSTVDSGNLCGHVRVLRSGLLELPGSPLLPPQMIDGLRDTLRILADQVPRGGIVDELDALLADGGAGTLSASAGRLAELAAAATRLAGSIDRQAQPEAAWWANAFDRQVRAFLADLTDLAPWLAIDVATLGGDAITRRAALDRPCTLRELGELARAMAAAWPSLEVTDAGVRLTDAFLLGSERIFERIRQVDALAERCASLAAAEFAFLYEPERKLLAIGYWVAERRMDNSSYDLLASEARLASYVAIASGQLPFDHWFALGRRLTTACGRQVLLSWSGSMFEYLMPLLVMPAYDDTLLDQTCRTAVARQVEYGRRRGVPWGISESCYNVTDVEGTYQYRAFGVPGLGLQRGLGDDVVIAPYASLLALLVDPRRATANLKRLAAAGSLGPYGFCEAVDYTTARVPKGESSALVRAVMVHHAGMGLLALEHAVLGARMQGRFLRNPEFRAAALLLQERIPRAIALSHPHAREAMALRRVQARPYESATRVIASPTSPVPAVHLLSNGRYHVMVTAAGAGYSRWNDIAVTRWREDPTSESSGVFCYVSDVPARRAWSTSFQPVLRAGRHYQAVFTPGRAEFRRIDDEVETYTQIAVSTEDDLEIRRVKLANGSHAARSVVVTSFAEVVLATGMSDELHRAFGNLFVASELLPDRNALLMTRRPRSADERPPWLFCMMVAAGGDAGPCTFETDRARFVGRGRTSHAPAALDDPGPLPGTGGSTLDPCAAIRRTVRLPGEGSGQVDLILGAASTREAAMALVAKYQDHRMADRVFEVAPTHSRAVLGHLGAGEVEAREYGDLASAVVFPIAAYRAPPGILRRNRKGQAGLWAYGISGDLPIVLLRVSDGSSLALVEDALKAHAFWRMQGLPTDLVIWNEDPSGYRRALDEGILALIAAGPEAGRVDQPGGVFVRHIDAFPEEDRVLLQSVARIVLKDVDGTLGQHLERWRLATLPTRVPMLASTRRAPPRNGVDAPPVPRDDLVFANGFGGFTRDGREYIIDLPPGRTTPAPWVNVIANPRMGTVVSETGSAYTWFGNAQLFRLSPWSNDAVGDPGGEVVYVRDDASGRFFSPMPWPRAGSTGYACRHGFGYSVFEHVEDGLSSELTTFVAVEAPVKFLVLKVRNLGTRSRTLSVLASVDLVLGDVRSRNAMHVVTELDPDTGAILARNRFSGDFPDAVAFLDCSEGARSVSGDRAEILGRGGDPSNPAAMRLRSLSGRLGPALDPCAAMQVRLVVPAGAEREVVFTLGAGDDAAEATSLLQRHRSVGAARLALAEVWRYWKGVLGVLYAETPDPALDILVNGWLPYQVLSCRLLGRSGFYQSGGAFGFRDQLQDCMALLHEVPEVARQHIVRSAARQFVEGDVQHWWHPPSGRGVRTSCSDDLLWLPWAVARYVDFTGDHAVLDAPIPYLAGRALNEGEESYYDLPGQSDRVGTLYEHCTRAILRAGAVGVHGLPLMGGGDWNDGMNRVGQRGRGESVWLAFFLSDVLTRFAPLARRRGDVAFVRHCAATAAELGRRIEAGAWDGEWYRRAWFDDGTVLGSAQNAECRIDSLPQSWATLAGVGDPERRRLALDSLWKHLVSRDLGIIRLFTPPFDGAGLDPGYIQGYPPGLRENGGQYTHAAIWAAMAFALSGRTGQAGELVSMLNPIRHALDPEAVERYKVEPYVLAADIYDQGTRAGRGGWTWYTGSAAWYYRLLHEVVLGLERHGHTLTLRPRVPASWDRFKVHYRFGETFYHLEFTRGPEVEGPARLTLDGRPLADGVLNLVDDRRDHRVEVRFGPGAGQG